MSRRWWLIRPHGTTTNIDSLMVDKPHRYRKRRARARQWSSSARFRFLEAEDMRVAVPWLAMGTSMTHSDVVERGPGTNEG